MKLVHGSPFILATLIALSPAIAFAVAGPVPDETAETEETPPPVKKTAPAKAPLQRTAESIPPEPTLPPESKPKGKYDSVDQIKGVGKYKFGSKLSDFPPAELRPVDPRAKGTLLRVSPYGDNFLVNDLKGLSWGNIPLSGLIITFHEGILIDIQMAMRGKKLDFQLAERAFKDKYGPNQTKIFPLQTWSGNRIQVTLILVGEIFKDEGSLDQPAQGKVEMFDQGRWEKFETVERTESNRTLEERHKEALSKVKSNP